MYSSKRDFDIIKKTIPELDDPMWLQYYRNCVNDDDKFDRIPIENGPFEYQLQAVCSKRRFTKYDILEDLFKYQSLDKYFSLGGKPNLLSPEEQYKIEMNLLRFMYPNMEIKHIKINQEGEDRMENFPWLYQYFIGNKKITVCREYGVILEPMTLDEYESLLSLEKSEKKPNMLLIK